MRRGAPSKAHRDGTPCRLERRHALSSRCQRMAHLWAAAAGVPGTLISLRQKVSAADTRRHALPRSRYRITSHHITLGQPRRVGGWHPPLVCPAHWFRFGSGYRRPMPDDTRLAEEPCRHSRRCIASHPIPSHHITSHRVTSHHITSHHITSHYITRRPITHAPDKPAASHRIASHRNC